MIGTSSGGCCVNWRCYSLVRGNVCFDVHGSVEVGRLYVCVWMMSEDLGEVRVKEVDVVQSRYWKRAKSEKSTE